MDMTFGWVQVVLVGIGELAILLTYVHMKDSSRQNKIDDRFVRLEKSHTDLSAECARRDELHTALNAINLQLSEIRTIVVSQKEKS